MDLTEVKNFLSTNDEGKTYLNELIEKAKEGLVKKNSELLGINKKLKTEKEEVKKINDNLIADNERLEDSKTQKTSDVEEALKKQKERYDRDFEKLTGEKNSISTQLTSLLVDSGLKDALISSNVSKEYLPAVTALLKLDNKIEISSEGDIPKAVIGSEDLSDFVKSWSESDTGKLYTSARDNSGGGAHGSNIKSNAINVGNLSPQDRMVLARKQSQSN